MSKKLTVSSIKKEHAKQFGEKRKISLSNGCFLNIHTKFKATSIQKMLLDYQEILEQMKSHDIDFEVIRDIMFVYHMLLLRHFTDLDNIPNDINAMVVVCEELINLNLLEEIMNSFDPIEVGKVNSMMKQVSENSNLISNQIGDIFAQAALNQRINGDENEL